MAGKFRHLACIGLLLFATASFANEEIYKRVQLQGHQGKVITLPVKELSQEEIHELQQRVQDLQSPKLRMMAASVNTLPEVNLGMNGVPVLDQGVHGSCVTFSVTAAIDAALYGEDKISQLCLLELGQTLEHENSGNKSGWSGAFATKIIDRIEKYGVIDKSLESSIKCGGLSSYPTVFPWIGDEMKVADYQMYSYPVTEDIKVQVINKSSYADTNIERIKQELRGGNRVLVGVHLDSDALNLGFSGTYQTMMFGDTLVLNDKLLKKVKDGSYRQLGGHHMIIYGYNDNAEVNNQRGVFYLRNSWGTLFGDYGDAYVTYDYLKVMLKSAESVRKL